jgi:outer membrane protein TolC
MNNARNYLPLIVVALVLIGTSLHAQEAKPSTLEALVKDALEKNQELEAARRKWEAAKQKIPQARALPDPMFGVDLERHGTQRVFTYSDAEWMIRQQFPWFGKRGLRAKVEEQNAAMAFQEYLAKGLKVAATVKQSYYDIFQRRAELDINLRMQKLLTEMVEIASAKYATGKIPQTDLLKAQTELSKLLEEEFDKKRALAKAETELNQALNRPAQSPLKLDFDVRISFLKNSLEELQGVALQNRPELRARKSSLDSAQSSVELAKQEYRPDFEVRLEARQFNGEARFREYDTAIFINIPWGNRAKRDAGIREAEQMREMARADLEAMKTNTLAEVKKLYDGIRTMEHHYELYQKRLIPQARATMDSARGAYVADKGNFLDLLDAQRMLLDLEMQQYHHIAELQRLRAQLEAVLGVSLDKLNTAQNNDAEKGKHEIPK